MKIDNMNQQYSAWRSAKTLVECEAVIRENSIAMDIWMATHKPVIIMCPPTYYSVDKGNDASGEVAGNAFLKYGYEAYFKDAVTNYEVMQEEWQNFHDLLQERGAEIILIPPHEKFPDQVFTADLSFSCVSFTRDGEQLQQQSAVTVLSRPAHPNRIDEMRIFSDFLESLKNNLQTRELMQGRKILQSQSYLEGVGDNILDSYRGIIISGYGLRNAETSLPALATMTGLPVYGVKCKKPFFHIDTTFAALPNGYVLYAPEVMHEESVTALENALFKGHYELKAKYGITVSLQDAFHFACNAVIVGKTIILQDCSNALKTALQRKGLDVIYTAANIANYAGGSLHCMSNTFNQPVFI